MNNHGMDEIKFYQPWSAPILHSSLSEIQIKELLDITDSILKDENKKSYNNVLAGEIENEWIIPTSILELDSFKNYIDELSLRYLTSFASQHHIETDKIPPVLGRFAQMLEKSVLTSAWFNDQKDDEYNPLHNHTGILSGVLYLKIPEYLPSRKNKDMDGTITFVGNSSDTDIIMTYSTITISPKVGDIFLFPSLLKHQVYPFRTVSGKGIRRSLSFNIELN
tara:strand:- start:50 stop:715 length:666 start_codon:yes stop_codon:yes gene_type:complete